MTKEEKMIRNLKRRRLRIIISAVLVIVTSLCLIYVVCVYHRLDAKITPEHIRSMASFEDPKHELPVLFTRFYTLAKIRAKLMFYSFYFAGFTGVFLALLIIELIGAKNRQLIISMWEKLQKLENEIKGHTDQDGQPPHASD